MVAALAPIATGRTLRELETIVARGQQTFAAVGRALLEIRDGELYRGAGFGKFSDYLEARWPTLARRSAYNAIAAAGVAANVDTDGLGQSHLVEISRLPALRQREVAALAAARSLTVRQLRALIREKQLASPPRRPAVLTDYGPAELPTDRCAIVVGDCRRLPFEDGEAHLERVRGGPCLPGECRHPSLIGTSPPYNAGLRYDADPTGDRLPWRVYWHELIVPFFRESYRVLMPGGRLAVNLASVLRMDTPEVDRQRNGAELVRRGSRGGFEKWGPPGAGGEPWAYMVDSLIWSTWRRIGLHPRERVTWVKSDDPDVLVRRAVLELTAAADGGADLGELREQLSTLHAMLRATGPENTITESTAWGTYCDPSNPVLRAVAEPIFVASKATHRRQRPDGAVSDLDPATYKALTRNAWWLPGNVDRSRHPAPWPTAIGADGRRDGVPDRLIRLYTWPGDLVVDPMLGSGAAAEAAVMLGRRFWGCDQSAIYVNDAARRVAAAIGGAS